MRVIDSITLMIVITGGAGLIGSAVTWALNTRGRTDLIIVDTIDHEEKRLNLEPLEYQEILGIEDFRKRMQAGDFDNTVEAIIHLGACSSTLEQNWEYLLDNNVNYTKEIIEWSASHNIRCIYASSAATYGDGSNGYSDDHALIDILEPLNLYGKSKLDVDKWALAEGHLNSVVALRYFNVFGPNEWHKGVMRSVVAKKYEDIVNSGTIQLFKSYKPEYADGEQKRDFIYVKDAVAMTLFFLDTPEAAGIFNIGSGRAESWNQLAHAMFAALAVPPSIEYIDMDETLREQYQYFTKADMAKIQAAGWNTPPLPLTDSVGEYIREYLVPKRHLS